MDWVIYYYVFCLMLNSFLASSYFCCLLTKCQALSGSKLFDALTIFLQDFWKSWFEKNQQLAGQQNCMQNYPVGKALKKYCEPFGYASSKSSVRIWHVYLWSADLFYFRADLFTASNLCLLLQKEQNVKGGEGPSGKQAVGINNGTR